MKSKTFWQFLFTLCLFFAVNQAQAIVLYKPTSPDTLICGHIAFKNGTYAKGVITKITADNITYRPCDRNRKTAEVTRSKKDIIRVTAADGAILYRSIEAENRVNESDVNRKIHPQAIIGAVFTILGALGAIINLRFTPNLMPWLIKWNLLLALFAIGFLLSISALGLIRQNIKKYKGEKITIVGIIFGAVIIGLILLGYL
jgi:hypothetical protein